MRVLHVDAGPGSAPDLIRRLVARLEERPGVEQAVAGPVGCRLLEAAAGEGLATLPLPWNPASARAAFDPRALTRLAREAGGRDLAHVHTSRALRTVVVALAASGAATRMVATRRAERAPRAPALWRRADLVLAVSAAARDALASAGVEAARIRVVPGDVGPAEERREAAAGSGAEREAGATLAAYREVLGSWRRRRDHARWMERAGRRARALPAGPSP